MQFRLTHCSDRSIKVASIISFSSPMFINYPLIVWNKFIRFLEGVFKRGMIELIVEAMKWTDSTEEEKEIREVKFDFENSFCNHRVKGRAQEGSNANSKATLKPTELLILNKKKPVVAPVYLSESDWFHVEGSTAINQDSHRPHIDYVLDGFSQVKSI